MRENKMSRDNDEAADRLSFNLVHAAAACPAQALELLQVFIELNDADREAIITHARRLRARSN